MACTASHPGRMLCALAPAKPRRTTALALAKWTPRRLVVGDRRAIPGSPQTLFRLAVRAGSQLHIQ